MQIGRCPRCLVSMFDEDEKLCHYCGYQKEGEDMYDHNRKPPLQIHEVEIPEEGPICESCQIPLQNEGNEKTKENRNIGGK